MKKITLLCILAFSLSDICFAQSNQKESFTISTYYPSPYGIYKTIRLLPSDQPAAGTSQTQPGTLYFNNTDKKPYIYNGTSNGWEEMGLGSSSPINTTLQVDSDSHVYPEVCSGVPVGDTVNYQICSDVWYIDVPFHKTFKKAPQVFVQQDRCSGREGHENENYTCARHGADIAVAYASDITLMGFRLWSSGAQPYMGHCMIADPKVTNAYVKAEAAWIAIGE